MKTKIYLSGGMNQSNWQSQVIERVGTSDFAYFNPREHTLKDSKQYTLWDLYYVKSCDIVFAYMQSDNPSGYGLSLELGYACALGKPIILIDEKSEVDEKFQKYFKIVRESSSIVFEQLDDGINFLLNLKNGVISN